MLSPLKNLYRDIIKYEKNIIITSNINIVYGIKNYIKIWTHSGQFHADEVFAVSMLYRVLNSDIIVYRGRDVPDDKKYIFDYIIDIGMIYDDRRRWYDHHQIDNKENPTASVGMIYKYLNEKYNYKVGKYMLEIIKSINHLDNNINYKNIVSKIISEYNPLWDELDIIESNKDIILINDRFKEAVELALHILNSEKTQHLLINISNNSYKRDRSKTDAANIINLEIERRKYDNILILKRFIPFQEFIVKYNNKNPNRKIYFVIYLENKEYKIQPVKMDRPEYIPIWFDDIKGHIFTHNTRMIGTFSNIDSFMNEYKKYYK